MLTPMSRNVTAALVAVLLAAAATAGAAPNAAHAAPCASVSAPGAQTPESAPAVTFVIASTAAAPEPGGSATGCTVAFSTADGTARAGEDYRATSGELAVAPGQVYAVEVPLIDDKAVEPDETFSLRLGDTAQTATATILDDDASAAGACDCDAVFVDPVMPQSPPPPPPPPPAASAAAPAAPRDTVPPKLVLSPGVQHGAVVDWVVSCPAATGTCAGSVSLTLLGDAGRRARAARAHAVTLGTTSYRLKPGEAKKVHVKLNRRGRRLLRKRKRLRAKATFRTRDSAGNVSTTSQIITLHSTAFRHS